MTNPPKKIPQISDILKKDDQIRLLTQKAKEIEMLDNLVKSQVGSHLSKHCRVATYEAGTLTLITHSNAWATHLRFATPQLRDTLRKHPKWMGLIRIDIKIDPSIMPKAPKASLEENPPPPKNVLPKNVAKQLISIADNLSQKPGNEKLKDALKRLAKHAEKD